MNERMATNDNPALSLYLSALDVSEDATQEEIEARYQELSAYLRSATVPNSLRDWAARQAALIDEAYAVLSDPQRREAVAVPDNAPVPRGPLPGAGGAVLPSSQSPAPRVSGWSRTNAQAPAAGEPAPRVSTFRAILFGIPWRPLALGVAVGIVALAGIIVVRDMLPSGGESAAPDVAQQAGEFVPLDKQRVAELMAQVQADPNNKDALFEIGESFFLAGEWQSAIDWFSKFLALEPANVHAKTDIGTANFNLGNYEAAKASWLSAMEIDPNDPQLHYNMGFFYANVEPVDLNAAMVEWQKVVELAPGTNLAKTAEVHLQGLAEGAEATPAPAAP